jgi:phosphoglycolate phosphatase-like HAD superfamily hydrolase
MSATSELPVVILDIDGTLVDSTYHHAMAWYRAFLEQGVSVPMWQVHRSIGMGGDQIVAAIAGEDVEHEHGDRLRERHSELFAEDLGRIASLPGAHDFVAALNDRGHSVVVASSADRDEVDHYVEMLDISHYLTGTVAGPEVGATKPAPDLCAAARELAPEPASVATLVVGDAIWDAESAGRAGFRSAAVLTGGIGENELRAHGARFVGASLDEVLRWITGEYDLAAPVAQEAAVLTQLQGEVAARPGLADDPKDFAATVERLAQVVVDQAERDEVSRRLIAMRNTLQQAGS